MKIKQVVVFPPVTITLETLADMERFKAVLAYAATQNMEPYIGDFRREMFDEILKLQR